MGKMQNYLAEALGTFALVVIGSFAIVSASGGGGVGYVSIAIGFGLALLTGLYAFGEVSGGHFNPAVSLAAFLDRRLSREDLIGYWVAQFLGAIAASLIVLIAFNDDAVAATTTQASDNWAGIVVEVVMTALFVCVILRVTKSGTYGSTALAGDPAHAARHPRRDHPDQRLVGEPGPELRPRPRRDGVHRHLALSDLPADRRDPRLGGVPRRRRGGHEPARRPRRRARRDTLLLEPVAGGVRRGGRPRGALEQRLDPRDLPANVVALGGRTRRQVRPREPRGRRQRGDEHLLVLGVDQLSGLGR